VYEILFEREGSDPLRRTRFLAYVVNAGGDRRRVVAAHVNEFAVASTDEPTFRRIVGGMAIRRIKQLVEASPEEFAEYDSQYLDVQFDREEVEGAFGDTRKRCSWETERAGAPFCTVPAADDSSARIVGGEVLAPTTNALCASCSMPGASVRCSALIHPLVTSIRVAEAGVVRRNVTEVYCAAGNNPEDGGRCVPGDRDCWRVEWDPSPPPSEITPPHAIHEALDFLSLQWKATIGGDLIPTVPVEALGGLVSPVHTRDDFKSRMSDLAAVIERFLGTATKPSSAPDEKWIGSLNRVEAVLDHAGVVYPPESIGTLRDIVAVRTALQHPGSRDLAKHLTRLGVTVPVADWEQAWATVRSRAVSALAELRIALRDS
jgi:hypothetical protein